MSTEKVYHYVYRITNTVENKHYYGKRSSKIYPKLDLGIKYFSSSKDKKFKLDQKTNKQNYKYKVISVYKSASEALDKEIKLHAIFDVKNNLNFYNRSCQTSNKFSFSPIGVSRSLSTRLKMSNSKKGFNNYNAKVANIYEHGTDKLIAEHVVIHTWAKDNDYNKGHLAATVRADRSKPHHWKNNVHYHKGIYARYVIVD